MMWGHEGGAGVQVSRKPREAFVPRYHGGYLGFTVSGLVFFLRSRIAARLGFRVCLETCLASSSESCPTAQSLLVTPI